ncbi:DUF4296 domain-containing protein [Solitalea longa]|uniref:DUF4296 domain-containing protein n=1 Tax=Solitalea longa TaxID=2079460 RepID=UPI0013FE0259|nr:DUF4296 domain-containing protein [Solitalea longa]
MSLILLVFAGCSTNDKPANLIPQDKMRYLLTDMHLIESRSYRIVKDDSAKRVTKASYLFVLKKYKVDTAQFRSSMEYYLKHPDVMDKMYEQMIDSLSKRQSKLSAEARPKIDSTLIKKNLQKEKHKRDSVLRTRDSIRKKSFFSVKKPQVKKI